MKKTRTYKIGDAEYNFNKDIFNELVRSYKEKNELRKAKEFEERFTSELGIGRTTYIDWKNGNSSPNSELDIQKISDFLKLSDWKLLLKRENKDNMNSPTERQRDSLKLIYNAVIDYLKIFDETNGFNDLWHKLIAIEVEQNKDISDKISSEKFDPNKIDPKRIENKLYEIAENEALKILNVIKHEKIVLIGLNNVYEDLCDFVYDVVFESYDEKLGYAYRFEAPVEKIDGTQRGVTTEEDYNIVLNKIHEILEPYFR